MNIALVGFMGSGKTTVGQALAERLGYSFIDLDVEIERETGTTIPDIFRHEGEVGFRDVESFVLRKALEGDRAVVSCGGGVVLRGENRDLLKERSTVVYLKVSPEDVFERVGHTGAIRPLLNVGDPKAEIGRLLSEREHLYEGVADIAVDTGGKNPDVVVDLIIEALRDRGVEDTRRES